MNKFIFDVDGTLTPSRQSIDKRFAVWFRKFCLTKNVYLVTGSDYPKTLEQLGESICMSVNRIYNCSGNDVWENGINVKTNDWKLPEDAHEWLSLQLTESEFHIRTGLHLEHRPGMCNFSVVGRNANQQERNAYVHWDNKMLERVRIANKFNLLFPDLQATVGGETGIDIAPKGADKSQILIDFNHEDHIHFFGDRMDEGGNDYPLKKALWDDYYQQTCYPIKDWQDTWEKLKCV